MGDWALSKEVEVTHSYEKEAKGPGTWKGCKDTFGGGGAHGCVSAYE